MSAIKSRYKIPPRAQSCHTAVWNDGELVFEGHIPAPVIESFLGKIPEGALGLSVPGMPIGSPGMEMPDGRFQPYRVFQLNKDGTTSVFAEVTNPAQQYE